MKKITIIVMLLGTISLNAQSIEGQVIGTTGGTVISGSVIVTATTGEAVVTTATSGAIILTQGYQQATDTNNTVEITEIQASANYKLFPNPTTNGVKLEITTLNLDANVTVDVYAKNGKLIARQAVNLTSGVKSTITIDLEGKAAGVYFIKILDSKANLAKTLKVIKE